MVKQPIWKKKLFPFSFQSSQHKEDDSDAGSEADHRRKNINYGTKLQAAKGTFLEYLKESSIHGFKYIGNHKHSIAERLIWLVALVISIITCSYLIRNIWEQRINNPVIVSFNEKLTRVWEIPFPSVTICPQIKTRTEIFNFTDVYWKIMGNKKITKEEEFFWDAISQVCYQGAYRQICFDGYGKRIADASDLADAMQSAAPREYEVMSACYFRGLGCDDRMKRVVTQEGICYSFNSLTSNHYQDELINANIQDGDFYDSDNAINLNWNIEKGYKGDDLDSIPSRVISAGAGMGLRLVLLYQQEDEHLVCDTNAQSFKVILHTPGEEPLASKNFIRVSFDKANFITIKPKIVEASEGLKAYDPQRRQCYYHENDRFLRYFKVYNQPNCELECLANETLKKCGCVEFSMPRNSSHSVCGSLSMKCIFEANNETEFMNFKQANNLNQSDNSSTSCNCLPLCSSVQYKAELGNQMDFDLAELAVAFKVLKSPDDLKGIKVADVRIRFKDEVFNGLKRSELYSDSDMIADFGGLLGLFMGVSILSLVELVYFCTIKLWNNLKRRQRKNLQQRKFKETP